ncbi:MAG: hypothetical protein KJO04_04210 [Bacteroidia bacterium]|nr:hypothetical protein [Bacteroidia bacterium]
MKYLNNILPLLLMLYTVNATLAQDGKSEIMNARIEKTFVIDQNGTKMPLFLKILEHRDYPEAHKLQSDSTKFEDAKVTKLIAIDEKKDGTYDRYIVLTYYRSLTDSFKLVARPDGFAIQVDDKELTYFHETGIYFVNNADKDFFKIEEFRDII